MSAGCRCRCGARQQTPPRVLGFCTTPTSPRPHDARQRTSKPTAHRATLSEQPGGRSASPSRARSPAARPGRVVVGPPLAEGATWAV